MKNSIVWRAKLGTTVIGDQMDLEMALTHFRCVRPDTTARRGRRTKTSILALLANIMRLRDRMQSRTVKIVRLGTIVHRDHHTKSDASLALSTLTLTVSASKTVWNVFLATPVLVLPCSIQRSTVVRMVTTVPPERCGRRTFLAQLASTPLRPA